VGFGLFCFYLYLYFLCCCGNYLVLLYFFLFFILYDYIARRVGPGSTPKGRTRTRMAGDACVFGPVPGLPGPLPSSTTCRPERTPAGWRPMKIPRTPVGEVPVEPWMIADRRPASRPTTPDHPNHPCPGGRQADRRDLGDVVSVIPAPNPLSTRGPDPLSTRPEGPTGSYPFPVADAVRLEVRIKL
jgi:hypothetical protein